jgi:hypothetical protein
MDFRQRLEQNRNTSVDSETPAEPDEQFTCPYFATDRGKSPACLDLRLRDGKRYALPYAYFTEMMFDVDAGILIATTSKMITITGRNLTRLFDYLVAYRVKYIQANIGSDPNEDGLFVKEIRVDEM